MGKLWRKFTDPELPEDYFRIEIIPLRYLGIEMYGKESISYLLYSIVLLFNTIVIFLGLEMYELFVQLNIAHFSKDSIEVANYVLTHTMGAVETILLYINRKKIGKMMKSLHLPPFAPDETRGGTVEAKWIRQAIQITEVVFVLFSIVLLLTIMSSVFEMVFFCITKPRHEWAMPFAPMSIGEFQKEWPYFEMLVLYQIFEIFHFAFITLISYLLMSAIMAHISVQLRIMSNGLRNLRSRSEQQAGNLAHDENVVHQNMNVLMRNFIHHHMDVLNLAAEMESLCSLMILSIFFFSVILMCFILFFASLYPIGSVDFFHFFFYWWCITCQVASYCYWGSLVSFEAENVAHAAAEIDWPGASKGITNAMRMIMLRAQRPLYITAGKFVPLSMETLMMIVKGSFSYFMVLKQTQDEADAKI